MGGYDRNVIVLERTRNNRMDNLLTHPLVREDAPHQDGMVHGPYVVTELELSNC
jgi:hypothetical protein